MLEPGTNHEVADGSRRIEVRRDLEAADDLVVVGDRDRVHPAAAQRRVECGRVRAAIGDVEPSQKPLGGPGAVPGMDVQIRPEHPAAHGASSAASAGAFSDSRQRSSQAAYVIARRSREARSTSSRICSRTSG